MIKLTTMKSPHGQSSYAKTLDYFSNEWFGNGRDGKKFFTGLGKYLDKIKFPADKMTLDPYHAGEKFDITIKGNANADRTKNHVWCQFEVHKDTKIVSLYNFATFDFSINKEKFKDIINDFLNQYNKIAFDAVLKENGIKNVTDKIDVVIVAYAKGKPTGKKKTLQGTVKEIIDQYTEANDALRYINGAIWRFEDKKFEKLYDVFTQVNKGNLSLDAALKRGATVD